MLLNNKFDLISKISKSSKQINSLSGNEIEIANVSIDELSDIEIDFIKENLVAISEKAETSYTLAKVAKKIYENLFKDYRTNGKSKPKNRGIISGFASEFFLICFLRDNSYEQFFCYRNLEENSAKKGFDGLYLKDDEVWLVESKSSFKGHNNSHKETIRKAYDGISNQLSGKTSNNPWENAANHTYMKKAPKPLTAQLEEISMRYEEDNFKTIDKCNIILGSTVIDENVLLSEQDIGNIDNYIKKHKSQNEKIVAINLKHENIFINIMEELKNE